MNDFSDILDRLPHRYPFLMVDKVIEVYGEEITAIKNVTANEPYMQGHFPGNPVMPGVMILEALFQVGGLLATYATDVPLGDRTIGIATIDTVKFRKKVVPGDQLIITVSLLTKHARLWKLMGQVHVGETLVTEARWTGMIIDGE